jgi:magnesium transporter
VVRPTDESPLVPVQAATTQDSPDTERTTPDGHALACTVFRRGKSVGAPQDLNKIDEILDEPDTLVWFDAVDPTSSDLELVQREFGLHPLAIEDAVQAHQRPKIESYGSYWFIVVLGVTLDEARQAQFHEIAIFASDKFLVTVRHQPAYPLQEIQGRLRAHPERLQSGSGFLLYTILDTVVDGYLPVAETFEERVDRLEEMLFEDRPIGTVILREIFRMKQDAQQFRHAALPMRDILNPIIRGDIDMFSPDAIVYFRDVYDHAIRVIDQLDTLRDLMGSALEIHLSVVANRQNEVAKQLTIIATIFLPLSFLVGFFGQNFTFLVSHITGPESFFFLGIGTEVVAVVAMLVLFKRRGWF